MKKQFVFTGTSETKPVCSSSADENNNPLSCTILLMIIILFSVLPAGRAAAQLITLTSQETMWVDANNCASGPRGAWLSFTITNNTLTPMTNVEATFSGFTGTNASYFITPSDLTRTFTLLAPGEIVPVYYYIDYSDICNHPHGGGSIYAGYSADYTLTVKADGTMPVVRSSSIITDELVTAAAAGITESIVLGNGFFVGQTFTQTVVYSFGNNTDLFFQPAGEAGFQDACIRLVGSECTATSGGVTGILGVKNQLWYPTASVPGGGGTITIVYTWEIRCQNTSQTLHPWSAAKSGNKYKFQAYMYDIVYPAIPPSVQSVSMTKSVSPTFLASPTSDGGYGPGIAQWTVTLQNSATVPVVVDKIIDVIPSCMTISNATAPTSNVTISNSASVPLIGSTGSQTWVGLTGANLEYNYEIPANASIQLVYQTDISSCASATSHTNSATAKIGNTTVGPVTDTLSIGCTAPDYGALTTGDESLCNPGNPAIINFSSIPTGSKDNFTFQWYYKDGLNDCPSGTSTEGWTLISGATNSSYDPPSGLTGSRTYAVIVIPDILCSYPSQWASNCRKVSITDQPTIILDTIPSICKGLTSVNLTFSSTTGNPDRYSINYDAAALSAGFINLTDVPLTTSPIALAVPSRAAPGTYNGILTVSNSTTGCSGSGAPIKIKLDPCPDLSLTKMITAGGSYTAPGNTVSYEFTITNTGNVTLPGPFTVNDSKIGALTDCANGPLDPGVSVTCNSTYIITIDDLNNGSVTNTAYATTLFGNTTVTSNSASATANGIQSPKLTTVKSTTTPSFAAVGELINYSITVTNSGNVTVSNITLSDPNATVTCVAAPYTLQPGGSFTCTAVHPVTQADLDAGFVKNISTASGTGINGDPVTDPSDEVTVNAAQSPKLTTVKSTSTPSFAAVDELINYSITVTNSGNVTVSNITLSDPNATVTCVAAPYTLQPGGSFTCTAVHPVTQADLDAGFVKNISTASGTGINGDPVTDPSDEITVTAAQSPKLTTVKSTSTPSFAAVGELINYSITVTNSGNVTVSNITLSDPNATVTCVAAPYTLQPGGSFTCTAVHPVTQADLDAGFVKNISTASGTGINGDPVTDPSDEVTVNAAQAPKLTTVKSTSTPSFAAVGELINYSITVTNSGNVTVSNITLSDPNATVTCVAAPYTLQPGGSFTCTAVHTVTQADLDAGFVKNISTASGTGINGDPVTDPSDEITVTAVQSPKLTTVKSTSTPSFAAVGELINYSITVINSGNVTVSNITLSDPNATVTCLAAPYTLQPGGSFTCTAVHPVTQADLDAGFVKNISTASGTGINGDPVTDPSDEVTVNAAQAPKLTTVKSTSTQSFAAVGELINYSITVTNTGNVTISGITLSDPNATVTCLAAPYTLQPGGSFTCTAVHPVTQADLDAGFVKNISTASGTGINGDPVTDPSDEITVTAVQSPKLTTVKSTSTTSYSTVGDLINYGITVTNTGNVTISGITLSDPNATVTCLAAPYTLQPGGSFTCTAVHPVTQADLDAGFVKNISTASGTGINGDPVTDPSDEVTVNARICPAPVICVVNKCGSSTLSIPAGGTILWSNGATTPLIKVTVPGIYTVTRTIDGCSATGSGMAAPKTIPTAPLIAEITQPSCSVTTGSVVITGLPSGAWVINPAGIMGSGTSTVISGLDPGTYAGTVTNSDGCTSVMSAALVIKAPISQLTTVKTANTTSYAAIGDQIYYSITVTNSGNFTISGITVSDPNATILCPDSQDNLLADANLKCAPLPFTLAPCAGYTCTAVHTVTQEDLNAGWVTNIATATGTNTYGSTVTDASDPVTVKAALCKAPVVSVVNNCGSSTLSISAGGTILWSTGATTPSIKVTAAGTYTVTRTVNGCSSTGSGVASPKTIPTAPLIGKITQPSCAIATGSVVLTGLPSGIWIINPAEITGTGTSTVISGLYPGTYTGTVTNAAGCTSASSAKVVINAPVLTPIAQPAYFTQGMACVTRGLTNVRYTVPYVAGMSYIWSYSGAGASISGTSNSVLLNFSATATSGMLSVRAFNSCGISEPRCGFITVGTTIKAGILSDAPEIETMDTPWAINELKVYPNPSANVPVTIEFRISESTKAVLEIFSSTGQRIERIFEADVEADITQKVIVDKSLAPGVYLYSLRWKKQVITGKFIITK